MNFIKRLLIDIFAHPFKSLVLLLTITVLGSFLYTSLSISASSDLIKKDFMTRMALDIAIKGVNNDAKDDVFVLDLLDKYTDIFRYYDLRYDTYVDLKDVVYKETDRASLLRLTSIKEKAMKEIDDEVIILKSGRFFTSEELKEGASVILIPEDTFYISGEALKVNDTLVLEMGEKNVSYTIIGTFSYNDKVYYDPYDMLNLIIPYENFRAHFDDFAYYPSLDKINITLSDSNYNDQMTHLLEFTPIFRNVFEYETNAGLALRVSEPLDNLNRLAKTVVIVFLILITLVLSVLSFIFAHGKRYEFGVLLAMGERKIKLIILNILELLLIALPGFALSYLLGRGFEKLYGDELINNATAAISYDGLGVESVIANYQLVLSGDTLLTLLIFLLYIVVASSFLSSLYIANIKIRKLLF